MVGTPSKSTGGDDRVFLPDMRKPLVEPARKFFEIVEAGEFRVLLASVLYAQPPNLTRQSKNTSAC